MIDQNIMDCTTAMFLIGDGFMDKTTRNISLPQSADLCAKHTTYRSEWSGVAEQEYHESEGRSVSGFRSAN